MRGILCIAGLVFSGCAFQVHGFDPSQSNGGGGSSGSMSPPSSQPPPSGSQTPPSTDGGAAPPADMAVVPVGAPCNGNSDCGNAGLFCAQSFFDGKKVIVVPGGYCTKDCSNGSSCPTGSACGSFAFGQYCLSTCPPDPCRGGYTCCAASGPSACTPTSLCSASPHGE
jgi:hypothetical protein